jgi:hypothetical protein
MILQPHHLAVTHVEYAPYDPSICQRWRNFNVDNVREASSDKSTSDVIKKDTRHIDASNVMSATRALLAGDKHLP